MIILGLFLELRLLICLMRVGNSAPSHLPQGLAFSQLFSCLLWLVSCFYLNHTGQGPSLIHTHIHAQGWAESQTFSHFDSENMQSWQQTDTGPLTCESRPVHKHTQMHRGSGERHMHSHIKLKIQTSTLSQTANNSTTSECKFNICTFYCPISDQFTASLLNKRFNSCIYLTDPKLLNGITYLILALVW